MGNDESHLIHDMHVVFHSRIAFSMWNVIWRDYDIVRALRWGVALVGVILYWALLTPS